MRERSIENRHAGHAEMKRLFIAHGRLAYRRWVRRGSAARKRRPSSQNQQSQEGSQGQTDQEAGKKSGGPTQDGLEGTRDQSAASFAFNPVHWRTQGA
jgi:hypothetical protein